ncbi:TIGR04372 family glycosyltransferase [bacterium]|jgi:putative glycosyltransferase (TIGR04372 family)|nr:TIGR04372 family glycosyltransferase [bacterium]
MTNIIKIFFEKQKGKKLSVIISDIILRFFSLLLFPFIYFLLFIINLVYKVKIGFLYNERLGHLVLNTDLFLRRIQLGLIPNDVKYIFFVYNPANKQIVTMFKRVLTVIESEFFCKILAPFAIFKTRFYQQLPFLGNEYYEFNQANKSLFFTKEEIGIGNKKLQQMGLKNEDWYVCIFSRDHTYYNKFSPNTDVSFSTHRNSDINTYNLAVEYILQKGGFVIRMGNCVGTKLNFEHEHVIDYASQNANDFMDIFLAAHCRFYLGSTSGAVDLAAVFDIPVAGVNIVPIGYPLFGKKSIFISKKIINKNTFEMIPFSEQLNVFSGNQVSTDLIPEKILDKKGWKFEDNSDTEILDITKEMFERLENKFKVINTDKIEEYQKIFPKTNIYKNNKSPIGQDFLEKLIL